MKIYSELGVGTTIKLYLPRETSMQVETEPGRPASLELPLAQRRKVLVVEDDGAAAALDILAQDKQINVLLTDVVMPGLSGRKLLDAVKESRPEMAVLFMTGYSRNAIVHNGVLDQSVRLISKPFTLDELAREMRAAIFNHAPASTEQRLT